VIAAHLVDIDFEAVFNPLLQAHGFQHPHGGQTTFIVCLCQTKIASVDAEGGGYANIENRGSWS
jgi:hypothetical protein